MTVKTPLLKAEYIAADVEATRQALLKKYSPAETEAIMKSALPSEVWLNDEYQVALRRFNIDDSTTMVHLSIKRVDREPARDWRDLQQIKNQLVGAECEGCELFPAES